MCVCVCVGTMIRQLSLRVNGSLVCGWMSKMNKQDMYWEVLILGFGVSLKSCCDSLISVEIS